MNGQASSLNPLHPAGAGWEGVKSPGALKPTVRIPPPHIVNNSPLRAPTPYGEPEVPGDGLAQRKLV